MKREGDIEREYAREIEKERESVLFLIYCIWQDFLCLLSKVSYVAADRYIIV